LNRNYSFKVANGVSMVFMALMVSLRLARMLDYTSAVLYWYSVEKESIIGDENKSMAK